MISLKSLNLPALLVVGVLAFAGAVLAHWLFLLTLIDAGFARWSAGGQIAVVAALTILDFIGSRLVRRLGLWR